MQLFTMVHDNAIIYDDAWQCNYIFLLFFVFEMQMMHEMHVAWNARQHAAFKMHDNANELSTSMRQRSCTFQGFKVS